MRLYMRVLFLNFIIGVEKRLTTTDD